MFFTLALNAVVAGVVAPVVTGSVATMATAALLLVAAGLLSWSGHLLAGRRLRDRTEQPPALAPTDSL